MKEGNQIMNEEEKEKDKYKENQKTELDQ